MGILRSCLETSSLAEPSEVFILEQGPNTTEDVIAASDPLGDDPITPPQIKLSPFFLLSNENRDQKKKAQNKRRLLALRPAVHEGSIRFDVKPAQGKQDLLKLRLPEDEHSLLD